MKGRKEAKALTLEDDTKGKQKVRKQEYRGQEKWATTGPRIMETSTS